MNNAFYVRLNEIKATLGTPDAKMTKEGFIKVCTVYFTYSMITEDQYNELMDFIPNESTTAPTQPTQN